MTATLAVNVTPDVLHDLMDDGLRLARYSVAHQELRNRGCNPDDPWELLHLIRAAHVIDTTPQGTDPLFDIYGPEFLDTVVVCVPWVIGGSLCEN